ncbi:MAG: translational GTPase TypA [Gammaproteobacteria bacterium]|nr:translational GTPase TypA [Gammaproteobacteria bacterium]
MSNKILNIAIIAHVDHGKTTLVDQLLKQSGALRKNQASQERIMDSNPLEKERGITILAKNCAVDWNEIRINIVDTPGHADFGGEVERALSMVDGVLLLIDAVEGPMPQTRFVTQKALALGLKPIVVINKVDRLGVRIDQVINEVFDLFDNLQATVEQLDFPIVYASGLNGWASLERGTDGEAWGTDLDPLFATIVGHASTFQGDEHAPLQLQISSLDYSSYVGRIAIGRVSQGIVKTNSLVSVVHGVGGVANNGKIGQIWHFQGIERVSIEEAGPGEIVLLSGLEEISIGATITDIDDPRPLPNLQVDPPTLSMHFCVNNSPYAGKDGKFVTSRHLRDRLEKELQTNVALRMHITEEDGVFEVSGRGELHLTILMENMRREGYELAVSKPRVVLQPRADGMYEPIELLVIDIEEQSQGTLMQILGERKGELANMQVDTIGRVRLEYLIPARGLIGFHTEFMNITRGTGLSSSIFHGYAPYKGELPSRKNGVLISMDEGVVVNYALGKLDDRGRMFVTHGDRVYEGMIVGIHSRDNDLVVNATRTKQLTNFRVSGKEDAIKITPPLDLSIEFAVAFIEDDELVEMTPKHIRLRKKHLKGHERKKASRDS